MKTSLLLVITVITAATVLAQDTSYKFECSKLSSPSQGCASYNEMVQSNDKDLLATLRSKSTFVCFRPYEDVFFTLAYLDPDYDSFVKVGSTTVYEASGFLSYERYKNGVNDAFQLVSGKWKKLARDGQAPYFEANSESDTKGFISDEEVGVGYSFPNLSNTTTTYSVAVRRSTLRFVETFAWDNPPEASKNKKENTGQSAPQPTHGKDDFGGYCVFFPSKG